jgi:hypothetical protein
VKPYLALLVAIELALAAPPALAQQYVLGGSAQLASGMMGGGPNAAIAERARTRLRIAVDFRVDEFPKDILAVGMVAELEPHTSFGVDLRYLRRLSRKLEVNVGGIAFIYPESLIGPSAGLNYHLVLSPAFDITLGPEINVFVIGTDLPSESVVWQALFQAGIHVDL